MAGGYLIADWKKRCLSSVSEDYSCAHLLLCPGSTLHIFSQEPFQQHPKLFLFAHNPRVSLPHRSEPSTLIPSTPLVKCIGFADPVANPNSATWLLRSSPDRFVAKSSNDAAQTQSGHARNDSSYYLKRKAPDSSDWLWWLSMLSLLTTSQLSHSLNSELLSN